MSCPDIREGLQVSYSISFGMCTNEDTRDCEPGGIIAVTDGSMRNGYRRICVCDVVEEV